MKIQWMFKNFLYKMHRMVIIGSNTVTDQHSYFSKYSICADLKL